MTVASISQGPEPSAAPPTPSVGDSRSRDHRPPRLLRALACVVIGMLAYPLMLGAWPLLFGVACTVSEATCAIAFFGWFLAPVVGAAAIATWTYRRTS